MNSRYFHWQKSPDDTGLEQIVPYTLLPAHSSLSIAYYFFISLLTTAIPCLYNTYRWFAYLFGKSFYHQNSRHTLRQEKRLHTVRPNEKFTVAVWLLDVFPAENMFTFG